MKQAPALIAAGSLRLAGAEMMDINLSALKLLVLSSQPCEIGWTVILLVQLCYNLLFSSLQSHLFSFTRGVCLVK